MRTLSLLGLTVIVVATSASEGRAQQGRYNRTSVTRAPAVRDGEELRPFRTRGAGTSANGQYRRAQVEPTPRVEPAPRPTVGRNYFPGLNSGVAQNRNVPSTGHVCVPGRRAFMYGR